MLLAGGGGALRRLREGVSIIVKTPSTANRIRGKISFWASNFWSCLVSSWPWPLTFWSQNLISSSTSPTATWCDSHERFVRCRVAVWSRMRSRTHVHMESPKTECLQWLIAGECMKRTAIKHKTKFNKLTRTSSVIPGIMNPDQLKNERTTTRAANEHFYCNILLYVGS